MNPEMVKKRRANPPIPGPTNISSSGNLLVFEVISGMVLLYVNMQFVPCDLSQLNKPQWVSPLVMEMNPLNACLGAMEMSGYYKNF